jgi:hypothetical protein
MLLKAAPGEPRQARRGDGQRRISHRYVTAGDTTV